MRKNILRTAAGRSVALASAAVLVLSVPSYGAVNVQAAASVQAVSVQAAGAQSGRPVKSVFPRHARMFRETVDYPQRPYEHYSAEVIEQAMADFGQACDGEGQEEEVARLYDLIISEFDRLSTMMYMAQIQYDRDVLDQDAVAEQAYTSDLYSEMGNKVLTCLKKGMQSSYRPLLEEKIGREYAYAVAYYEDSAPEEQALSRQEEELMRQYDQLAASGISAEYQGEQWDYKRLEAEPDLDSDVYYDIKEALVKEKNRLLGGKFLELVQVRQKIAEAAGYENYAEYANDVLYGRDYTLDDVRELCRNVKEKILPLDDEIWYLEVDNASYESLDTLEGSTVDEILDTIGPCLGEIEPELGNIFQYMRDNHLYDIAEAEDGNRTDASYTVGLPSYGDAYIFINRDNTFRDYQSVTHEFGHFSAYYYNTVPELFQGFNVDVCEIQSQGLEMLALSHAGDMFGQGADAYVFETVTDMLFAVISASMIQEFEEAVYTEPDMTLEDMNRRFKEIQDSYDSWYYPAFDDMCYEWVEIPHLFYSPMYYIGYGTSALSALDLWVISRDDWDKGIDTYLGILKEGMDAPYRETVTEWGMRDVFDADELEGLVQDIRRLENLSEEVPGQEEAVTGESIPETSPEVSMTSTVQFVMVLGIGTVLILQVMILCVGLIIIWLMVKGKKKE